MKKICMLLTSDVERDTRVLNEAEALSAEYDVTILVPDNGTPYTAKKPFKVKKVKFAKCGLHICNLWSIMNALTWAACKEKADIYHGHDLHGLLIGYWPALYHKKKLVYDSHELWPEMPNFSNLMGIKWILKPLEAFGMMKVEKGIASDQSYADYLEKAHKKPFTAIRNIPVIDKIEKNKLSLREMFKGETIVLHTGFTGAWRGIEQIIEAAQYLPAGFAVVFLGANRQLDVLEKKVKDLGLEKRVHFLPGVPPEELLMTSAEADLAVALTQNVSLSYYYSLPNKLFQYLAAEVPILGSDAPEYRRIILDEKIGEVVDPSNPKQIAKKILDMVSPEKQKMYRANLKGLAKRKYNWEAESQKLLDFYRGL